jgi:hypothetical protein
MRVFKNKWFVKFMKKHRISDAVLWSIFQDIHAGLIDVDYGSGVVKQRFSDGHQGKSGSYRSVIIYRQHDRMFFVFAFSKNDRQNISHGEEKAFKQLAKDLLSYSNNELDQLVTLGELTELNGDFKNTKEMNDGSSKNIQK